MRTLDIGGDASETLPMQNSDHQATGGDCGARQQCPLQSVHSRLEEAHIHWHHALDSYSDPGEFRTHLNACIQALRNVTFVLQKQKSRIPDFEAWYGAWQDRMRRDPVLRWVVEARNTIVKQGDLETNSVARVAVVASYLEQPQIELTVNPLQSNLEIAAGCAASISLPEDVLKGALVRVERRWVSDDLPDNEILDRSSIP